MLHRAFRNFDQYSQTENLSASICDAIFYLYETIRETVAEHGTRRPGRPRNRGDGGAIAGRQGQGLIRSTEVQPSRKEAADVRDGRAGVHRGRHHDAPDAVAGDAAGGSE